MKRRLILLIVVLSIAGCRQTHEINTSEKSLLQTTKLLSVEFVSEPQEIWRINASGGRYTPQIAVGDLTGDGYPEISLAMGAWVPPNTAAESEGYFYSHPIVFSWNGKNFEQLKAEWLGIQSYAPQISVYRAQGTPVTLIIADIDQDNTSELIVGTISRGAGDFKGAIYIFHWDGQRFQAEYSDYCLGAINRIDTINNEKSVIVSASSRPIGYGAYDRNICPENPKGPDEFTTGLYVLYATQEDEYATRSLELDSNLSTILTINMDDSNATQFIRGSYTSNTNMIDWKNTKVLSYTEEIWPGTLMLEIENPIMQMTTAVVDGNGTLEIVTLTAGQAQDTTIPASTLTLLVFQKKQNVYQLIHSADVDFSTPSTTYMLKYFAVGDADNDGKDEILASNGELYDWGDGDMVSNINVMKAKNKDFCLGLESIYIGKVYNNEQNRIIFTARDSTKGDTFCPDASSPQMYIVNLGANP